MSSKLSIEVGVVHAGGSVPSMIHIQEGGGEDSLTLLILIVVIVIRAGCYGYLPGS